MIISTKDGLTERQAALFFAAPESAAQRQYEALRAYFIDQLASAEVARRFGYSPGAFRVLCHQFRHDAANARRSSPSHAPAPLMLPFAISSANAPSPCENNICRSTTFNVNSQPRGMRSASTR
jgi:transposase-like protein